MVIGEMPLIELENVVGKQRLVKGTDLCLLTLRDSSMLVTHSTDLSRFSCKHAVIEGINSKTNLDIIRKT